MGTSDQQRRSHVVRYWGKDENEDVWVDVEVLDRITFNGRQGNAPRSNQFQKTTVNFAFKAGEHSGDNRKQTKLKVYVDPDDKDRFVEIPATDAIAVKSRSKRQYQVANKRFDNNPQNRSRDSIVLKIVSNDIDEDKLEDNENGKKQPPSDPRDYYNAVLATNSMDEDQKLNVEVADKFGVLRASKRQSQGVRHSGLWNDFLLMPQSGDGLPGVEESNPNAVPEPLRLDPLMTIVNFGGKPGGGSFTTGDECCEQYFCKIKKLKDDQNWEFLGSLGFSESGNTNGASYKNIGANAKGENGTPTFVLIGTNFSGEGDHDSEVAIIMTSHDGQNWFQSARITEDRGSSGSAAGMGVVWDESAHAFYAVVHTDIHFDGDPPPDSEVWEILYRSSTGTSWGQAGKRQMGENEEVEGTLLPPHYRNKAGTRDGIFGYWEKKDEHAKVIESVLVECNNPCRMEVGDGFIHPGAGGSITITHKVGKKTKTNTVSPGCAALCATFAGNILVCGGKGGAITSSIDMGKTWQHEATSPFDVYCAIGGGKKDFDTKKGTRR